MPSDDHLQITIYNLLGERVIELKNDFVLSGEYEFLWNGKDSNNNPVNSGIYIVNVRTNNKNLSEKVMLLK